MNAKVIKIQSFRLFFQISIFIICLFCKQVLVIALDFNETNRSSDFNVGIDCLKANGRFGQGAGLIGRVSGSADKELFLITAKHVVTDCLDANADIIRIGFRQKQQNSGLLRDLYIRIRGSGSIPIFIHSDENVDLAILPVSTVPDNEINIVDIPNPSNPTMNYKTGENISLWEWIPGAGDGEAHAKYLTGHILTFSQSELLTMTKQLGDLDPFFFSDISTEGGVSGSPVFIQDIEKTKWNIAGVVKGFIRQKGSLVLNSDIKNPCVCVRIKYLSEMLYKPFKRRKLSL